MDISVVKRDGTSVPLDLDKIHKMVTKACEELSGVSESLVEMNSGLEFYDGIETKEIQRILIKSAVNLISLDAPNYQYVASRLLLQSLRKGVYGQFEPKSLFDLVKENVNEGVYDHVLLENYTEEEFKQMDEILKHDRDFDFVYAGLQQMVDKYLVQDRSTGKIYESPQIAYILCAATIFSNYPKDTRMKYIKTFYDAASTFKINLPTPIIAGCRTKTRQYSSCCLIDCGDDLKSIEATQSAILRYTARRAGIGLNMGRVRGVNAKIRSGEVVHTGQIPFLKAMTTTNRSCTQNGVRGGAMTTHYPIWHWEIEDIINLKNNKGSEDNRVRTMDYSIQFCRLFYDRLQKDQDITLFSPEDVPEVLAAFYSGDNARFEEEYTKAERKRNIRKKKISMKDLMLEFVQNRFETGRMYVMNVDHCNSHVPFNPEFLPISMSNLCQEVTLPTTPLDHIDDEDGMIATCTLAAVNAGKMNSNDLSEMSTLADVIVRALDEIIEHQEYPIKAAEIPSKKQRNLAIGIIGYAHYLAKNKCHYSDRKALELTHEFSERWQYELMQASVNLAKEKGACEAFSETRLANNFLPIDTYKKNVDKLVKPEYKCDWNGLRKEIREHGIRNCTLTAIAPTESSSVVSGETNGIEMPRSHLTSKQSKKGKLTMIVPGYPNIKNSYSMLWEQSDNKGYLDVCAIMQKFFCQSISTNTSYNPENYEDGKIPIELLIKEIMYAYSIGIKTLYYNNTNDGATDNADDSECDGCKI